MGALNDMEVSLFVKEEAAIEKNYSRYCDFISRMDSQDRSKYADLVRYAMTISHNLSELTFPHGVLFIGGIGVLGNIAHYCGNEVLPRWRGTHDVDVAVVSREYTSMIPASFDTIDVDQKSNSIENKRVVRGWSTDSDNNELGACEVDVYHPNGNPKEGVSIQKVKLVKEQWYNSNPGHDDSTVANFFGIPIRCASPSSLLEMKLKVDTKGHLPRKQDLEDIIHLLAVLEKKGIDPAWVQHKIGPELVEKLHKVLDYISSNPSVQNGLITSTSDKYRGYFLR